MGARQTTTAVANGGQTSYASGSSMSASGGRSAPMPVAQSHPSPIPGASTSSSLSGFSFGLQHQNYHRFLNRSNTPTSRHTDTGSYGRQSNPNSDDSSPDDTPLNRFLLTHFFSLRDIKCPACRKPIPSDDIECHLVTCLSKPLISYNEDILTEDKGECSICLDDLKAGQTIARLPCLCIYHKNCIDEWFQVKRSCPEHPND